MSFHWNLSSDEEDETEEWKSKLAPSEPFRGAAPPAPRKYISTQVTPETPADSSVARMPTGNSENYGFDFSDDDEDEVEWEDAHDEEEEEVDDEDSKMPAKPITIDMNSTTDQAKPIKKKKRKSRRTYRFQSLPPHLQSLLVHIQQSHLLTLASRAVLLSRCCSDMEVLHVAHSLVPTSNPSENEVPTEVEVREFVSWYAGFVNNVAQRRRRIRAANEAAGAPTMRRSKKRKAPSMDEDCLGSVMPNRLLETAYFLSPTHDDHPPMDEENDDLELSNQDKVQLFVAMARSKGWRTRYVTALDPIGCDLNVDHPLFLMNNVGNIFRELSNSKATQTSMDTKLPAMREEMPLEEGKELGWVEILCEPKAPPKSESKSKGYRWIHVDPSRNLFDQPNVVESLLRGILRGGTGGTRKATIAYALAVEHIARNQSNGKELLGGDDDDMYQLRLTDVTPRYSNSWSQSLSLRGNNRSRIGSVSENTWWADTLKQINRSTRRKAAEKLENGGTSNTDVIEIEDSSDENAGGDLLHGDEAIDAEETAELRSSAANEAIPTSKAAFNNHPVYAIPSVLKASEVFAPDAKNRICGIFKGQPVYRRSDVHTALAEKKWLYQGRKVKDEELKNPAKKVKARKKPAPKGFQPLQSYGVGEGNDGSKEARQRDISKVEEENDGMVNLYGRWQTLPWSPIPVGPNDPIPTNEYNNVEMELINPGLVHLTEQGLSKVAKKLGIPYAPCLLGFEGHGGNRTPTIRGIVVHEHNVDILRCAHGEFMSSQLEREHEKRADMIRNTWQRLIGGVLTRERLDREYG